MRASPKISLSERTNSRQQSNTSARAFIIMKPHQRDTEEVDDDKSEAGRLVAGLFSGEQQQVDFIVFINWTSADSGLHTRAHRDRRRGVRGEEHKRRHTP